MTTPGGDVGAEGPPETAEPVAGARRGPDWVAALAWGGAGLFALVVAGLATFGFQTIAPHWPAISARWQMAIIEAAEGGENPTVVEPLPGVPPEMPLIKAVETEGSGANGDITNPTWLVLPQGDFPNRARRQGIESGEVDLTCPVSATGEIRSCWIVSETPADAGFGQAALAGAVHGRIQTRTVDGVAVGGIVSFKTKFALE